jgi:sugar/nucleoside kinase (ribokinase family)
MNSFEEDSLTNTASRFTSDGTDTLKTPDLVILGSVALDDIETPFGKHEGLLGGSAAYAAYSASFFASVGVLSIVGIDFPKNYWKLLMKHSIDVTGIQVGDKTFHWQGFYEYDMSVAKTLCTELNVLGSYSPELPDSYKEAKFVFLGNTHPHQQIKVIQQLKNPQVVAMDTMNLWIEHTCDDLIEVIKKVNVFILNEGEARQLFKTANIVQAGKKALQLGPQYVIIKKGENGAVMFSHSDHFSAPGYPLEIVKDPTGCGDCFGGGIMGYIASEGKVTDEVLRKAIIYGSVCASYNAEDFSLNKLLGIKKRDIEVRFKEFKQIRHF